MVAQEGRTVPALARLHRDGQQLHNAPLGRVKVLLTLKAAAHQGLRALDTLRIQHTAHAPLLLHHELVARAQRESALDLLARGAQVLLPAGGFQLQQRVQVGGHSESGEHDTGRRVRE
jgi:hypothetical protein